MHLDIKDSEVLNIKEHLQRNALIKHDQAQAYALTYGEDSEQYANAKATAEHAESMRWAFCIAYVAQKKTLNK